MPKDLSSQRDGDREFGRCDLRRRSMLNTTKGIRDGNPEGGGHLDGVGYFYGRIPRSVRIVAVRIPVTVYENPTDIPAPTTFSTGR